MTSRGVDVKFRCEQDCLQCGCPGHTVKASYNHTTDFYRLDFDEGKAGATTEIFDEARLLAMIEAISKINWGGPTKLHPEAAAERERCAKIAEGAVRGVNNPGWDGYALACDEIAARIKEGK